MILKPAPILLHMASYPHTSCSSLTLRIDFVQRLQALRLKLTDLKMWDLFSPPPRGLCKLSSFIYPLGFFMVGSSCSWVLGKLVSNHEPSVLHGFLQVNAVTSKCQYLLHYYFVCWAQWEQSGGLIGNKLSINTDGVNITDINNNKPLEIMMLQMWYEKKSLQKCFFRLRIIKYN